MSRAVVLAVIVGFLFSGAVSGAEFEQKWLYAMPNFANEESIQNLMSGMREGAKAGVTHVQVKDPKFGFLELLGPEYFENINRVLELADELDMVVVPVIFPFGYSGGYLTHDPNLAAGLPVKDAPFVVRNGVAHADPAAALRVVNNSFEGTPGSSTINGWSLSDRAEAVVSLDGNDRVDGRTSLRMTGFGDNVRGASVSQRIPVEPFKYYRLTIWRKTQDFQAGSAAVNINSNDSRRGRLSYTHLEFNPLQDWRAAVTPTSDWQEFQISFNTLESTAINVSVSVGNVRGGTIWWDNMKIEPAGLANVLRRPIKPLVVKSADGSRTYMEHRDFEYVYDPLLGNIPNPPGREFPEDAIFPSNFFDVWHEPPGITLTPHSRINEGERLLVSYYHPDVIYGQQVLCSMIDPKIYELMDDQARRIVDAFNNPKHIMFNHDEIRIGGWEESPDGIERTPGEILAYNIRRSYEIARKYAPEATFYTWSDMFDRYANARPFEDRNAWYYLVAGNFDGSWEGLPSDVVIFTWHSRPQTLRWFADRGHKQILCGYYDGPMQRNITRWMTASEGIPNVVGMMYTTWIDDFSNVEEFFRLVDDYPDWVD